MEIEVKVKDIKDVKKQIAYEVALKLFAETQYNLSKRKWDIRTKTGIKEAIISDTGNLLRNGFVSEENGKVEVVYNTNYAEDVEFGTPPGRIVPYKVILGWVHRKLGIKGKKAEKVAKAIQRKIYREGTQPRPFIRKAVEKLGKSL